VLGADNYFPQKFELAKHTLTHCRIGTSQLKAMLRRLCTQ